MPNCISDLEEPRNMISSVQNMSIPSDHPEVPAGPLQVPEKPVPVTLLSGFLGSGKTTLLQHILTSDHGLRIAVIVNDIGAINVDASLIKQTHRLTRTEEKVIALQNGCICCTLRGDLLEELARLASLQDFDYVIIESSGISEPEQVAETFDIRLAEQLSSLNEQTENLENLDEAMLAVLNQIKDAGGLEKFARLDTTVTVIDAFTLFHDFETAELLSSRRDDVVPEDERTVSDLMVDQIEFADVIIVNKIEMVSTEIRERISALIAKLNHRAKVVQTSYSKVDVKELVNTGLFNLERAQTGYGWLQDLHAMTLREVNGRKTYAPKPETEEYNVHNFIYSRRRPFHPLRLYTLLHDKFILQLEHDEDEDDDEFEVDGNGSDEESSDDDYEDLHSDEDDELMAEDDRNDKSSPIRSTSSSPLDSSGSTDITAPSVTSKDGGHDDTDMLDAPSVPSNATILANKRASSLFARLFRSKGEFFLASRPQRAGEWSQAGAMLTLQGGRPWFCTLAEEDYLTGSADIDKLVQHDIASGGEWGDRHQEIVFIGEKLDITGLEATLDECLLSDAEWAQWQKIMRSRARVETKIRKLENLFDDGFPDWPDEDEEDEHDHEGHKHGTGQHGKGHKHRITKQGVLQ